MMSELATEKEIVDSMSKGNIEAFDFLYKKYYKAVFKNISKVIHQTDIAEDLLQEVFISLWENQKKIDPAQDIGGWLFVVSYHKSITFLKKRVREKITFTGSIEDIAISNERDTDKIEAIHFHQLNDAVNLLSPRKQVVFKLCRLQGKSYSEAARIVGISTETVKDYLKDSYKFVRKFVLSKNHQSIYLKIFIILMYFQL